MEIKGIHLAVGAALAGVGWLLYRSYAAGSGLFSRGRTNSGFDGDVITDDGSTGASSAPAVAVAKSAAGKRGGARPADEPGGWGGAAGPLAPGDEHPYNSGLADVPQPRASAPAAPPVYIDPIPPPTPRTAITVAKNAAPVTSDLAAGRLDVMTLGAGGLFSNLPTIRRSAAVTTDGASTPAAVSGAKAAAKGGGW